MEKTLAETQESLSAILMGLPNIPHASVPVGKDSTENPVIKTWGSPPQFDFAPKAHWDIGDDLNILDFERAAKITGARFPLYFDAGARLERALINFMLDLHTREHGYLEVLPPFMVNRKTMTGTGQLPKFEEDLFKLEEWDYFLIPTAEVPVTNIHRGEILDEDALPDLLHGLHPLFPVGGRLLRQGHPRPDPPAPVQQGGAGQVLHPRDLLCRTGKSARTMPKRSCSSWACPTGWSLLCTGDMGFSAAKTYDIEVWMPAQDVYREISSCSNFEDFQARRGNIRFRRKGKKGTELVHTLNGSGLAVGRTLAAILENYQQADGSVVDP